MKTVILNDSFLTEDHLARLKALGSVELCLETKTEEQIIERLHDADAAVIDMWEAPMNQKVLTSIPTVKYMTINSTGFDAVDLEAARQSGITISNVPGFGTQAVAEHTIALLLAVTHHIVDGHNAMQVQPFQIDPANKSHYKFMGTNIGDRTLGIIGLGQIGMRVAQLAQGIGMKVIAYNRTLKNIPGVELVTFNELLKRSDFISLNGAHTPDQTDMINRDSISLMKSSAIVINTARGAFIDDAALADAIRNKQLAGAGLDFLHEWDKDNPLLGLDNVVLNPHSAWFTAEALNNLAEIVTANVEAFANGQPINVIT